MIARRLLLAAARGGGSFVAPPHFATTLYCLFNGQNGDAEYHIGAATYAVATDTWTEYASNPVLSKGTSGAFDDDHVKDPALAWDGSQYVMYYSGYDGSHYRTGRATAASHEGPWTKTGMVLDYGSGGDPDEVSLAFPTVLYEPSDTGKEWKLWYRGLDAGGTDTVCYAYSSDGVTFTKVGMVLDVGSGGAWDDVGIAPAGIVKDGGTYYLFIQGRQNVSNPRWQGGLATFTDPEGTYTKDAGNPTMLARYHDSGTTVVPTADVNNGDTTVQLADTSPFHVGEPVAIADGDTTAHIGYIASIDSGTQVTLDRAVVGTFTGGGKVFRSFAYNSVVPRSIIAVSGGWEMFGTPFQPVDDLTQPASKLWEGAFRWTASSLTGSWAYDYVAGRGLLFPLVNGASWHTRSAENPSVIEAPTGSSGGGSGGGGGTGGIGGTGGGTYPTSLQDAIDAMSPGDTLDVTGYTFHEAVTIATDNITIEGCVIDGDGVRTYWADVTGDDVTLRNMTFQDCAVEALPGGFQHAGVAVSGARFEAENLLLEHGPYACMRLWSGAEDAIITDCDMSYGPEVGLLGFESHGTVVSGGRYHHNQAGSDVGNEAGGIKFGGSDGITFQNVEADHNAGPGLWSDFSDDVTITGCHAHHNTRSGIHFEIGDGATITGNTVNRNCTDSGRNRFEENGIFISSARNAHVTGNTVAFNNPTSPSSPAPLDIGFISQNRAPLPHDGNVGTGNVLRSAVTAIAYDDDWAGTGHSETLTPNTLVIDSDPLLAGL